MYPSVIASSQLPSLAGKDPVTLPEPPEPDLLLDPAVDPLVAEYRLAYAQQVRRFYPDLNEETALVLGQMAANRARYGVTYPPVYQRFLDSLDRAILAG